MNRTNKPANNSIGAMHDPDLISIGLGVFSAITGAAALVVQIAQYRRDVAQDIGHIRKQLSIADSALNQLDGAYREFVAVLERNQRISEPLMIGGPPFFAEDDLMRDLNRIRQETFQAGVKLEKALDSIANLGSAAVQVAAREISNHLGPRFKQAMRSDNMLSFMLELGRMLEGVSSFVEKVGKRYNFQLTYGRQDAIKAALAELELREK